MKKPWNRRRANKAFSSTADPGRLFGGGPESADKNLAETLCLSLAGLRSFWGSPSGAATRPALLSKRRAGFSYSHVSKQPGAPWDPGDRTGLRQAERRSFAQSGQIGSASGYSMQSTQRTFLQATHSMTWFSQNKSPQNGHSTASSRRSSTSQIEHCTAILFSVERQDKGPREVKGPSTNR